MREENYASWHEGVNGVHERAASPMEMMRRRIHLTLDLLDRVGEDPAASKIQGLHGRLELRRLEGHEILSELRRQDSGKEQIDNELIQRLSSWRQRAVDACNEVGRREAVAKLAIIAVAAVAVIIYGLWVFYHYHQAAGLATLDFSDPDHFKKLKDLGTLGIARDAIPKVLMFTLSGALVYISVSMLVARLDECMQRIFVTIAAAIPMALILSFYHATFIYEKAEKTAVNAAKEKVSGLASVFKLSAPTGKGTEQVAAATSQVKEGATAVESVAQSVFASQKAVVDSMLSGSERDVYVVAFLSMIVLPLMLIKVFEILHSIAHRK